VAGFLLKGEPMKFSGYMTRALRARDRRYESVLTKLGYGAPADAEVVKPAPEPVKAPEEDIEALRAAYEAKAGEPADKRWGAARIKSELAAIEG
jgi:hypothetical protein